MAEILAGAAVGSLLQVIHQSIKKARDTSYTARASLDRLEKSILSIAPVILQIEEIQKHLDQSMGKVIQDLNLLLHKIASLLDDYAKVSRLDFAQRHGYKKQIIELEGSLKRMIEVDVQMNQWLDIKQIMNKISQNENLSESSRPKHKINFHIQWKYNKKEYEMRFGVK